MLLLALLGLLLAQDPDVDALLKQLEDEAIDVRAKAAAALTELGDKAEEKVKARMASADGELKNLCGKILEGIAIPKKLRGVLPPLRKVTIDSKDAKLKEVLEDLQRQSGMPMNFERLGDAAVSVQVKDATPLEAMIAVCRAASLGYAIDSYSVRMGMKAMEDPRTAEPTIRFNPGGFVDVPRQFIRHYMVEPAHVSLSQSTNFRSTTCKAQMSLNLIWPPDVKPDNVIVSVSAVTDDKGRSIYEAPRQPFQRMDRRTGMPGMYRSLSSQSVQLLYPAADAKSIASVRGTAIAMFVMEEKILTFETPEKAVGQKQEYDGLEVELQEFKPGEGTAQLKLVVSGERKTGTPEKGGLMQSFDYQQIRLRTEDGSKPMSGGMSGSGGGKTYTMDITYQNVKSKVVAIDVVMDTLYHEDKFDFELKDIPLPR